MKKHSIFGGPRSHFGRLFLVVGELDVVALQVGQTVLHDRHEDENNAVDEEDTPGHGAQPVALPQLVTGRAVHEASYQHQDTGDKVGDDGDDLHDSALAGEQQDVANQGEEDKGQADTQDGADRHDGGLQLIRYVSPETYPDAIRQDVSAKGHFDGDPVPDHLVGSGEPDDQDHSPNQPDEERPVSRIHGNCAGLYPRQASS